MNEYCDPVSRQYDVWTARQGGEVQPEPKTQRMQAPPYDLFG